MSAAVQHDDYNPAFDGNQGKPRPPRNRHAPQQILSRCRSLAAYADRELAIISDIKRGQADADAGNLVSHEDAMHEIYGIIEAAESKRSSKS